jgi:hypothetical protein
LEDAASVLLNKVADKVSNPRDYQMKQFFKAVLLITILSPLSAFAADLLRAKEDIQIEVGRRQTNILFGGEPYCAIVHGKSKLKRQILAGSQFRITGFKIQDNLTNMTIQDLRNDLDDFSGGLPLPQGLSKNELLQKFYEFGGGIKMQKYQALIAVESQITKNTFQISCTSNSQDKLQYDALMLELQEAGRVTPVPDL